MLWGSFDVTVMLFSQPWVTMVMWPYKPCRKCIDVMMSSWQHSLYLGNFITFIQRLSWAVHIHGSFHKANMIDVWSMCLHVIRHSIWFILILWSNRKNRPSPLLSYCPRLCTRGGCSVIFIWYFISLENWVVVSNATVEPMIVANTRIRCDPTVVLACWHIAKPYQHHYAEIS